MDTNKLFDFVQAEIKKERRGGHRPGSGRKKMKPGLKKQKKAFSLSPESVQALADLQDALGLSSQSAVVEFLALRGYRELIPHGEAPAFHVRRTSSEA